MSSVYQGMCDLPIPSCGTVVNLTTLYPGAGPVIVAAPTADISAAQARGTGRPGILVHPHELRAGLRIGRRVLVGETAERWHSSHCDCHPSRWEPVTIPAGMPGPWNGLVWRALCDCGAEQRVQVNTLVTGGGLSCGCYRRDRCAFLTARRNRERRTDFTGPAAA